MDDRLIFVSSDSHAGIPKELWSRVPRSAFPRPAPRLHEDNAIYPVATALLGAKKTTEPRFRSTARCTRRAGMASTIPSYGLLTWIGRESRRSSSSMATRASATCFTTGRIASTRSRPGRPVPVLGTDGRPTPSDSPSDRFLLTAAVGPCTDIDAAVAEVNWIADHGFTATYGPHYLTRPGLPELLRRILGALLAGV